jgi:hypothetical protein
MAFTPIPQGDQAPTSGGFTPIPQPSRLKGEGTRAKPFDLSGGYKGVSIPKDAFYRDARGNVRQNVNGLTKPDGRPQGNPIVIPANEREAYGKARERIAKLDTPAPLPFGLRQSAPSDDFFTQAARSTGVFDEMGYGVDFALQGAGNLVRRAMGKPVQVPARVAGQARMDFEQEQQASYARRKPVANALATGVGIALAGRPSGVGFTNPLAVGATAAAQNAPFALGRQEGSFPERIPGAARETALAFGLGSTLAAGGNALARSAATRRAAPRSNARRLSDEGVLLTPGQMMGGAAQRLEDSLTSIPILGDSIRSAQIRGIDTFDEAALSRGLAPIQGGRAQTVGREGVRDVTAAIGNAYDRALTGVMVAPDQQFAAGVQSVAASPRVPPALRGDLMSFVDDVTTRLAGPIDGQAWKAIDADLGAAIRAADAGSANAPAQRFLRDALIDLRSEVGGLMQRTDPTAFAGVRAADEATANLVRIRKASQMTATARTDGRFTAPQLNSAVQATDTSASNRAYSEGNALMQDLTDAAMTVLPPTVPDSGTPIRSLLTVGGLGGGAMQIGTDPLAVGAITGGILAGSAVYSRPVQNAINAIYRASTPGAARAAFGQLQAQAARNPALGSLVDQIGQELGLLPSSSSGRPSTPERQPEPMTR